MTWRNPNQVGQIYRLSTQNAVDAVISRSFPEAQVKVGDLILCLEHTGDCHYEWARLDWETQTQSFCKDLPVDQIVNYYEVGRLFGGYAVAEEWAEFEKLTAEQMVRALWAMHCPSSAGLLLPLNDRQREEYLRKQGEYNREP